MELELSDLKAISNKLYLLYPDFTVGNGITPYQLSNDRSWTITTGRELHPAPEDEPD